MADLISRIADWMKDSAPGRLVAFTGAGISTESGIPDFRSPGGIWAQTQPVYFDEFLESAEARYEYWRQKSVAHQDFVSSQPNVGHQVLAKWEQQGLLQGVVTQNIDGLHQQGGSRQVIELHGTAREIACLSCEARYDADPLVSQFLADDAVPACSACGGLLKHATISFGQPLDPRVLEQAAAWASGAELLLAMGSSLVVEPAASLPRLTKQSGGRLAIINRDATPQDDLADAVIHASIGKTLSAIDAALIRAL